MQLPTNKQLRKHWNCTLTTSGISIWFVVIIFQMHLVDFVGIIWLILVCACKRSGFVLAIQLVATSSSDRVTKIIVPALYTKLGNNLKKKWKLLNSPLSFCPNSHRRHSRVMSGPLVHSIWSSHSRDIVSKRMLLYMKINKK